MKTSNYHSLKNNKIFITSLALIFGLLLGGCSDYNATNLAVSYSNLDYGSHCSQRKQDVLVDNLRNCGAQVSYLGDDIYIIVNSQQLFNGDRTARLAQQAKPILNLVAQFLLCYQKMTVRVVSYTNRLCTKKENLIFARQQAQSVAKALWRRGIDARLIYALGGDGAKQPDSRGWKNRVEIITRRLP
jgi:outer membrane protein OmpA-like peptidoglycan-associated protein